MADPFDYARLVEHVHGHAGWLAVAALFHPAWLLRDLRRRADLSVGLSVGLLTAVAAGGVAFYGEYTTRLKQSIFLEVPSAGWMFERKEHLAFAAVALAWAGGAAYVAAKKADPDVRAPLRKAAWRAFQASFLFALMAAVIGTYVASVRTF